MTRQRRDPAEKAQEALDVALRRAAKLDARRRALEAEVESLLAEQASAHADVEYLAQNPHLKQSGEQPTEEATA